LRWFARDSIFKSFPMNSDRPKRRKGCLRLGAFIVLIPALLILFSFITGLPNNNPIWKRWGQNLYARSDSPDGKHRCTIYEQSPPWPTESPHVYTFRIQSLPSGDKLAGTEHVRNTDSAVLGDTVFEWSQGRVKVSTPQSTPLNITRSFSGDRQEWSDRN